MVLSLGRMSLEAMYTFRQGDTDSAITFVGMLIGAAFSHNFGIAASGDGVGLNGKIAVIMGICVLTMISYLNIHNSLLVRKGNIHATKVDARVYLVPCP